MAKRERTDLIITLDLPDAQTAFDVAQELYARKYTNVVVTDEKGSEIFALNGSLFQNLKTALGTMTLDAIRELVDEMETHMTGKPLGRLQ